MVNVGGTNYRRIEHLPTCATEGCHKWCTRRGGVVMSSYCLEHTRDEMAKLIETGMSYAQARQVLWLGRPTQRLRFVP